MTVGPRLTLRAQLPWTRAARVMAATCLTLAIAAGTVAAGNPRDGSFGAGGSAPLLGVLHAGTHVATAADACAGGWNEMPIASGDDVGTPLGIVADGGDPGWVVGGANDGILALRWDGGRWQRRAVPGDHDGINDAVVTRDGFLGVGYRRPDSGLGSSAMQPFSVRVSTTSATTPGVAIPDGRHAMLASVSRSGSGIWAVGTRLDRGRHRPHVAGWDGSAWKDAAAPAMTLGGLLAVAATPEGRTWVAGWEATQPGRPRPFLAQRSRGDWERAALPSLPGRTVLTDLAFADDGSGWAVGYRSAGIEDAPYPVLLRWHDGSWGWVTPLWMTETAAIPRAIAAGPDGELWVVGTQLATAVREERGFLAHRADGNWDVSTLATADTVSSEVYDVAVIDSGAIATGRHGGAPFVVRSCADLGSATTGSVETPVARDVALRAGGDTVRAAVPTGPAPMSTPRRTVATGLAPGSAPDGLIIRDRSVASGIAEQTPTWSGFIADLDRDGRADVFYSRHANGNMPRLAFSRGGTFSDGPTTAFSAVDRHGCDVADVDADGARDILCAVGGERGKVIRRNELALAVATDDARLVRDGLGISDPTARGRLVAFMRLDDDQFPEVFIANESDRDDGLPATNRFYRNVGGRFVPAPEVGLDTAHGARCVAVGDIDRDGDDDLLTCTDHAFGSRSSGLRLLRNEGGKLRDRTLELGLEPIGDKDVALGRFDRVAGKDIVQLGKDVIRVSGWKDGRYGLLYERPVSDGIAIGVGDASGDGMADIYVLRGRGGKVLPDLLLINDGDGRSFTPVSLPNATSGNADDVLVLDHDGNGLADFVILEGRHVGGQVRLLASYPAT